MFLHNIYMEKLILYINIVELIFEQCYNDVCTKIYTSKKYLVFYIVSIFNYFFWGGALYE
ncbi:hypothetical protein AN644_05080 [Candidatus Epulonipiscium fishelsonii]|nr:hypothetical protein AN644_05080 [Epulopiscium sp. SCG-C06WGA-EpuloA1]